MHQAITMGSREALMADGAQGAIEKECVHSSTTCNLTFEINPYQTFPSRRQNTRRASISAKEEYEVRFMRQRSQFMVVGESGRHDGSLGTRDTAKVGHHFSTHVSAL